MNKKFLSAILFGALMLTSTGTFVSCKDYDDDIKDLQTQVNTNKDAIAALQKLVGAGNWVTAISPIENGFTITMSNGQTQTITGIKGADGKNGTEWTIGEDGFWYKDGEKTDAQAVAKNGENGVTAPSPYINADGMWVIYNWDETAGEFVAKTTEISAQGTSAYVVEKDGVYTLNIANEAGEFVKVVLPASSDSFVVEAPFAKVVVTSKHAVWTPNITTADYKALLANFPAIGDIEKKSDMSQKGQLAVLVNPANVDLTDGFTFGLQTLKGMVEGVTLSNPTKGLAEGWNIEDGSMSRAANAEDCFWTLDVETVKDFKAIENAALVAENAMGTVVKTAFAYHVSNTKAGDLKINILTSADYAASIDLFADNTADDDTTTPTISFENEYEGCYIITLSDELQAEKYDLSIAEDGHTLNIGDMPADLNELNVKLNVIALGLNGKANHVEKVVTIAQTITAVDGLADKDVILPAKAVNNKYISTVMWDVEDFEFTTATQLNAFYNAEKTLTVTLLNEDGEKTNTVYTYKLKPNTSYAGNILNMYALKSDGETEANKYSDFAKFAIDVDAATYVPGTYAVELIAKPTTNSTTTLLKSEATMTVSNPAIEDIFSLAKAYTADGKVLQVVGSTNGTTITYTLADGIVIKNGIAELAGDKFVDVDNATWKESDQSETWGSEDWVVNGTTLAIAVEGRETEEGEEHLYKERNITGHYKLYANTGNMVEYSFKVKVMSSVYTADASNVTTTAAKLQASFNPDGKTTFAAVDLSKAVGATFAYGSKAGQAINLFDVDASTNKYKVYDYSQPNVEDGYVVTSADMPIAIDEEDLMSFGMSMEDYITYTTKATTKHGAYLTKAANNNYTIGSYKGGIAGMQTVEIEVDLKGWSDLYEAKNIYYKQNAKGAWVLREGVKVANIEKKHATLIALFDKYVQKAVFANYTENSFSEGAKQKDGEIKEVVFEFVDPSEAAKYVTSSTISGNTITAKSAGAVTENVIPEKVEVAVKMTIKDNFGMEMTKTFNVEITK